MFCRRAGKAANPQSEHLECQGFDRLSPTLNLNESSCWAMPPCGRTPPLMPLPAPTQPYPTHRILSYPFLPYPAPTLPRPAPPHPALPCPSLPFRALPFLTLPCLTLNYLTLARPAPTPIVSHRDVAQSTPIVHWRCWAIHSDFIC